MYILFPGRHLLLTKYQFNYLYRIINGNLTTEYDVNNYEIKINDKIEGIIFAVTSSNHSNTRRNPVPFYQRVIGISEFGKELNIPSYIYGIDDVGNLPNFASYVLKCIFHLSDGKFNLNPENTLVLCSTPVLNMYEKIGFIILPCELSDKKTNSFCAPLPWDIIETIANSNNKWRSNHFVLDNIYSSSFKVWSEYNIGEKVIRLFQDKIIGNDGDITETRDYNSYVRQMDEISEIKFKETAPFIIPGRIGDIGCAVGSWIKQATLLEKFRESDFYGIEITRKLYDICEQRKNNEEFANPFVFFSQKNAVSGRVFEKESMNTIHTSSLTHEIFSYGGIEDLLSFIKNRYDELVLNGVWINRDVIAPENGEQTIYMVLNKNDGINDLKSFDFENCSKNEKSLFLKECSTFSRFIVFSNDFRKNENYNFKYLIEKINEIEYIKLSLKKACEFMYKKDYVDNWQSEMHEEFCFWSYKDWCEHNKKTGFRIHPQSKSIRNEWIVKNRLQNKVQLFTMLDNQISELDYPDTHMILISEKI